MTVSAASALNVTGTDTDARDYTTASWTPTTGKVYVVAFAWLDLGAAKTGPTISGNNITWVSPSGNETGGLSTEPSIKVWVGYADSSATAGTITFSGCVSSGQTADGAIWGIAELSGASANATSAIVQMVSGQTANDAITTTLSAFGSANNATASWIVSYDNASTTGPAITAGTGFAITTGLNASQAAGGDGLRLAFQFRNDNDTSVTASAAAANDRMLQVAFEIRDLVTSSRSASIDGDGQFSATAFRNQFRSASIAGDGQFAATVLRTQFRTAAVAGDGVWAASGVRVQPRSASIAGNGEWAASAFVVRSASVSVDGAGSWDASAFATGAGEASCQIAGAGVFAASAYCVRFVSAAVVASGVWAATATTGRVVEQQRFGGTPQSRRDLDVVVADERLARILQDDEEVLLCLLT